MGAHSTITVSERRARNLMSMFAQVATPEDLGSLMDIMLDKQLWNCSIETGSPQVSSSDDELATNCMNRYIEELDG